MSIRSLTFQVVAMMAIPAFAAYHGPKDYRFTFSSFAREGVITLRTEGEAKGTYELGEESTTTIQTPLFDRSINVKPLVDEGQLAGSETVRPIAYIPQDITLTSISIVTPGDTAPETLILTLEGGTTRTLRLAEGTEIITLYGKDANGTVGTRSGVVHTYNVDSGATITLNPGTEHPAFEVTFQSNDAGGQVQNHTVFCLDGEPFLRITGKATLQHHIFKINAAANPDHSNAQSLATLLAGDASVHTFVDDPNTVIVVEFEGEGGGVSLDKEVLKSPIVFGSSVTPDKAHVHFPGTVKLESALTFRDGAAQGGVSIYGPTDTANYEAARWNPSAMLLRCDLTLCTPLPPLKDSWFLTHSTTIPAGRTFRIELPAEDGRVDVDNLPNLDFAAADSVIELALAGNLQPPSKYTNLMTTQSGTLVFDQDVTLQSSLVLGGDGLESTVILRDGHSYTFNGVGQNGGFKTQGNRVTIIQEGGTLTLGDATRSRPPLTLGAEETVIEVRGGTMTCATELTVDTAGTTTDITVAEGGTLTLGKGLDAGGAGTTATLDLTVAGTLKLDANLEMTPASRRTLTLAGGIIESTRYYPEEIHVTCGDGGTSDGEGLLDIVGGGTLTGSLVVDAAAGQGDLTLDTYATLKDLRDFAGTVSGAGRLEAIEGTLGDVTLGDTWLTDAAGKRLGDVLTGWTENGTRYPGAADFAGTIGFTAGAEGAQKKLDFTGLDELTSLGMAFRINNHQHVIMRLDQYADAVIRWPDNPEGITLTLIESGAYGGELTLPHFPHTEGEEGSGVKFEFATFDPNAENGYTVREDGYSHTHTEDGVNDTLTWDNPVFTGQGAWIDIEFNGDTRNTGWFTLGDYNGTPVTTDDQRNRYNGLLAGDEPYVVLEQTPTTTPSITASHQANFVDSKHPAQAHGSLPLHYRPFVALSSLEYPEAWTVSLRLSAPDAARTCILALGHNYTGTTDGIPTYEGDVYSLIFATGDTSNEICLWVVPGLEGEGVSGTVARPEAPAFTVTLADATTAQHTFSVICDGTTMNLYVDGAWLGEHALPGEGARLTNGLQVGVQLGGTSIPLNLRNGFADAVKKADGGSIDFLRFYKGAMPASAMVEVADRTPYVRENLRYVRYVPISTAPDGFTKTVPEGGETWRQDGAWQEETWDGSAWTATGTYADEPAEGAYLRLLVDEGDYALQVNVERRDDAYFYSTDRNYAALVVEPQEGNTAAGTVRLIPYGVNPGTLTGKGDALTQAIDDAVTGSAWYTTTATSTAANRTGFQYGKLRFTGGAYDPITEGDPTSTTFYGAAYLIPGGTTTVTVSGQDGAITWNGEVQHAGFGLFDNNGTCTQTGTRTLTYTYSANANQAVRLIFDGGVSYFSKYADMVVNAASTGIRTATQTWQRSGTSTRSWGTYYDTWTEGSETLQSTSEPTGNLTGRKQVNTLQAVAGMALTRGESAEVMDWQLSGPVFIEGEGEVKDDTVRGNSNAGSDQNSLDVWTVAFNANSTWKFFDDTRIEAHGGTDNAHGALGAGLTGETAPRGGLFARGVQTPGRLYLDFTATNGPATYKDTQVFSAQAWYRYGYEGNQGIVTESGMAPIPATGDDFDQAVAFQIRLDSEIGDVTLAIDKIPTARVQTFYVEEEAGATKALTLTLTRDTEKVKQPLVIWDTVVAAARLDVSNNNTGVASETSWTGNALSLRPADGIRTPVHRGNATHGHGAFIVGATEVDWDFGSASSVPRLEVIPGAELTFTVGQDFRRQDIGGITLVAQGKETSTFPKPDGSDAGPTDAGPTAADLASAAWIHHRSAEPFLGQDVELGEGAIFGFHAEAASSNADVQNEGVVLAGKLRLTGNATLRADFGSASGGAGAARLPHFVAAGGIHATKSGLTLIVDAPTHQSAGGQGGTVDWHCHTATLTGDDFRLWKTGPGTMTFYANTPPSVTGKVTVEEGTLAVTAAADTPIGAKGLHVKKGATLADSGRMSGTSRRVARIPDEQTLSGGGTVKGILRLESGATYLAKQGEALTADGISVDASLEADITIDLPTDYGAGTEYLKANRDNREERTVRRRLLPMKRTAEGTERWDSIAWIDNADASTSSTSYAARPPQVPAPVDYDGYVKGESPTTITGIIKDPLTQQYQNAGHAYIGATSGRTRAGTYALDPDELSDALLCFTNISAFVDASAIREGREYVDGTNFYVGYEFGISRQALVTIGDTEYVVLEVSVESVFNDGVSFPGVTFSSAQKAFVADFNSSAILSFDLIDAAGNAHPLGEDGLGITIEEVTNMEGTTPVADSALLANHVTTTGKRWFRIPYQDLLNLDYVKEDGNIRLRASASSPYARRPSTR